MSLQDPKCNCMTRNDPKTFLRGVIHDHMTYWTTLGPYQRPTWPQWASEKAPGWSSMTQYHVIFPWEVFRAIWGHTGTFWVMKGHFWCFFGPLWGPRGQAPAVYRKIPVYRDWTQIPIPGFLKIKYRYFSGFWYSMCVLKLHAREDAKSHWLHLFDFSPLCILMCLLKWPA